LTGESFTWKHPSHLPAFVYVVVQFFSSFKLYFPWFLDMVLYDDEFKTIGNKFKRGIKLNHKAHIVANIEII